MTEQITNSDVVVAGCDGSWYSLQAVSVAVREAAVRRAGVVLLAVARPTTASGLTELREAETAGTARAMATVKRAAAQAGAADPAVPLETLVVTSAEDPAVSALADRAVLLVLGSHGGGGQSAFSLASTSDGLIHRLRVPVLVPGAERLRPVTGSEQARVRVKVGFRPQTDRSDLLGLAAREAFLRENGLEVVAASRGMGRDAVDQTQHDVWQAIRAVPECGAVAVHVVVVEAPALTALLLGSRPGDLVVVGTRGGGTLAGLVPDSLARGVLDAAPCDVLVLPPGASAGRAGAPDRPAGLDVRRPRPRRCAPSHATASAT
jgi:nucleotide-binding universal stress UspA family protein